MIRLDLHCDGHCDVHVLRHITSKLLSTQRVICGAQVYALDLLGFGDSDKAILDYSIELWRDQLADFVAQVVGERAALVGNSIGSLVSLAAAHKEADAITGVACLNCADSPLLGDNFSWHVCRVQRQQLWCHWRQARAQIAIMHVHHKLLAMCRRHEQQSAHRRLARQACLSHLPAH